MKFISILALFLITVQLAWAQPKRTFRVAQFDIQYPISDEGVALQVSELLKQEHQRLQRFFPPFTMRQRYGIEILPAPEWTAFRRRMGLPAWSGGVYVARERKIFLPGQNVTQSLFTLEHTFRHELAHLFLQAYLQTVPVPRWYHEGFAEYVSQGNLTMEDGRRLANAIWGKNLLLLADIDSLNELPASRARLAYVESLSAFLFLLKQLGGAANLPAFHKTVKLQGWDQALTRHLQMDAIDFEIKWYHWLEAEYRWFIFTNLDFWLWVLAVLGSIGIYYQIRRRNKKRLAEWEAQERYQFPVTPPWRTEEDEWDDRPPKK